MSAQFKLSLIIFLLGNTFIGAIEPLKGILIALPILKSGESGLKTFTLNSFPSKDALIRSI